jgi:hypothetical protein
VKTGALYCVFEHYLHFLAKAILAAELFVVPGVKKGRITTFKIHDRSNHRCPALSEYRR